MLKKPITSSFPPLSVVLSEDLGCVRPVGFPLTIFSQDFPDLSNGHDQLPGSLPLVSLVVILKVHLDPGVDSLPVGSSAWCEQSHRTSQEASLVYSSWRHLLDALSRTHLHMPLIFSEQREHVETPLG